MSIRIESLSGPSEAERQCVRRILQRYNLAHFETTDEQEFTIVTRDDELTACGPLPLEPETVADASAAFGRRCNFVRRLYRTRRHHLGQIYDLARRQ